MKNNYWIRSGSYTLAQRVLAFLFGFGSYFFLVRYFDVDSFGVWTLYVIITASLEMARASFVQNAFVKFFNNSEYDKPTLFWSSAFLNTTITVIMVTGLLIAIPWMTVYWKTDLIAEIVYWYCGTSIVLIPFTQFNYLEQANHRFRGVFWSSFVRQGLFFLITIVAFVFFPGLPMRFFASMHFVSAIAGAAVSYYMISDIFPTIKLPDWKLVGKLFKFGKYILGTGLTSAVGKNADQVILGSVNHMNVALYNAGLRVLNFIDIPTLSIANIVYPKAAQAAAEKGNEGIKQMYEKSVATILSIILPIVLTCFVFAEFILLITAGGKYVDTAPYLRVMVLVSLMTPFNIQAGSLLEIAGKPYLGFYINLTANVVNLLANIILIPIYGINGAIVVYATCIMLSFILLQYFMHKLLHVSLRSLFKEIVIFYRMVYFRGIELIKSKRSQ